MRFRICERDYQVRFKRSLKDDDGNKAYGLCDPDAGVIWLTEEARKNPSLLLSTFVHELLHGVFEATGTSLRVFEDSDTEEENFIRVVGPALISSLQSAGLMKSRLPKPKKPGRPARRRVPDWHDYVAASPRRPK